MEKVSIVLVSRNGADRLPTTLNALKKVTGEGVELEFIFVDNASTDETFRHFESFRTEYPVAVLCEPRAGKSYGLNRALDCASGDYIAFIDDDIIICDNWVEEYLKSARKMSDCKVFTGQIRPDWGGHAPKWLQHLTDVGRSYGCTPINRISSFQPYHQAKGGNLFIRREAAQDVQFNLSASNYGAANISSGGEDTRFVHDIMGGNEIWYEHNAIGYHFIKPSEMDVRSVLSRYVRIGVGRAERLSEINKNYKYPSRFKIFRRTIEVLLNIVFGRFGSAMVEATNIAMLYGEWRHSICKRRGDSDV